VQNVRNNRIFGFISELKNPCAGSTGCGPSGLRSTVDWPPSPTGGAHQSSADGVRSRASPEVEEQRGGQVTVLKIWRRRCSVRALLRRGERRKRAGRGAVKLGGGAHLL
jgi:hypothetical protein